MRIILITSLVLFGCFQRHQTVEIQDNSNATEKPLTSSPPAICEGSWDDTESKKACEKRCDSTRNAIFWRVEIETLPLTILYECFVLPKKDMPEACRNRMLGVYDDTVEKCVSVSNPNLVPTWLEGCEGCIDDSSIAKTTCEALIANAQKNNEPPCYWSEADKWCACAVE